MNKILFHVLPSILGIVTILVGTPAHADFLVRGLGAVRLVDNSGAVVRTYGTEFGVGGPLQNETESVDAFALSGDKETVYIFGNTLGGVTNFTFDSQSGMYEGVLGTPTPALNEPWPVGLVANFGIWRPDTRTSVPSGGGNLFYIGHREPAPNDLLNIVDTTSGDIVQQIIPPAPWEIFDFAFAPGALGPQSRVYVATDLGVYYFEEELVSGGTAFSLGSPMPLVTGDFDQIEFGPDGNLYVKHYGNAGLMGPAPIDRYSASDGTFIDTFLAAMEIDPIGDKNIFRMQVGPDGQLYVSASDGDFQAVISGYDVFTRQSNATTTINDINDLSAGVIYDFKVLAIPEPSSALLALLAFSASLLWHQRK